MHCICDVISCGRLEFNVKLSLHGHAMTFPHREPALEIGATRENIWFRSLTNVMLCSKYCISCRKAQQARKRMTPPPISSTIQQCSSCFQSPTFFKALTCKPCQALWTRYLPSIRHHCFPDAQILALEGPSSGIPQRPER